MADVAVVLPEPRPEDDEDVVWGLSTASALWARGERRDAVVWLRRAAEAAIAAGQDFRASELGMYANELEDAIVAMQGTPAAPAAEDEADRVSLSSIEEVAPEAPAPAPPAPPPAARPASQAPPPPPTARPASQIPPPPAARPASQAPPPPPAPRSASAPAPAPAPVSAAAPAPAPAPVSAAAPVPSAASRAAVLPPPPSAAAPSPPAAPVSVARPSAPISTPLAPLAGGAAPSVPSRPSSGASSRRGATSARAPILDPWSDEPNQPSAASAKVASTGLKSAIARDLSAADQGRADEVIVQIRARTTSVRSSNDDDDVVTSAAPLEATLRRKAVPPRAPPPPPKERKPADAPAGHVAEAGEGISSKSGASDPPAPGASEPGTRVSSNSSPPPTVPARRRSPGGPPSSGERPAQAEPPAPAPAPPPPAVPDRRRAATLPSPQAIDFSTTLPSVPSPLAKPPASTADMSETAPAAPSPLRRARSAPPPPPSRPASPRLGAVGLDQVDAFSDLSAEMQERLVGLARVQALAAEEEASGFGAALLLEGDAAVCATILDTAASRAAPGVLVPSHGTFDDAVALRIVAGANGAKVALWEQVALEEVLRSCPWVLEELAHRADRLQALAGATMGYLGDVDEADREALFERLTVRVVRPLEPVIEAGAQGLGVALVGVGGVELLDPGATEPTASLGPGETLFPRAVLEDQAAPAAARAGATGAILLVGPRRVALEVLSKAPSLAKLLLGE